MLKVAVGHSEDVLSVEAAKEVLEQIQASIGDSSPQAGIIFCSIDLDHQLILNTVKSAYPDIELIGCTTDGELSSQLGFTEDSLTLMVFISDTIEIRASVGKNAAQLGESSGREAAQNVKMAVIRYPDDIRFAIILSDPINIGISGVDKGIKDIFGETFPIIGAAAAAHSKRRSTFQFLNQEVLTDSVVLLVFAGPVLFSWGIQGGLSAMGGKEYVTSVKKNVLYRIGDLTALDYFRHYIGNRNDLFMNYCLAVYENGRKGFYVRSAPFSDSETGTVTLNGNVPEGAQVQIGTADKETIVQSCAASLGYALENYPGSKPSAALLFSCAGRKMIMGTQVIQEVQTVEKYLSDLPFSGFYSYGEFGPLEKGEPSLFHGATFVTLLLGSEG